MLGDTSAEGEGGLASVSGCNGDIVLQSLLQAQGPLCYKPVVIIGGRLNSKRWIFSSRHVTSLFSPDSGSCVLNRAITVQSAEPSGIIVKIEVKITRTDMPKCYSLINHSFNKHSFVVSLTKLLEGKV